ncbi:hypothetical protein [Bifidobacterium platyrrhinorum]|uniref:Uncharacterized protein n=1 Tax=Bifidobacterium platyrrhinorum TaxID=2661628 RepID=A0A6L9SVF7_9BIFI|nr:hypothetical protein [Bifidobacterium platyrrhinorum]NEG56129.1 hypothetical protein [Bifidobacterium platyrrhinorum]
MRSMTYSCGANPQRVIDLIDPAGIMVRRIESLRTHSWDVELASHGIESAVRKATTVSLTGTCGDLTQLDEACRLFDADMAAATPLGGRGVAGTLRVDGWSQNALVTGVTPDYDPPGPATFEFSIALLDGVWRKPGDVQQYLADELVPDLDLDYPYDYPYDYAPGSRGQTVTNPAAAPMPFRMVIYGPAANPQITIGENLYALDITIPTGAYVTVESVDGNRTVVMTHENGDTENVFSSARRGTGLDGGEYIFQPIPAGTSDVAWRGFGFDLTVYEERSTPAWLTSS